MGIDLRGTDVLKEDHVLHLVVHEEIEENERDTKVWG